MKGTPRMLGEAPLREGERWTYKCGLCGLITQGGGDGFEAHVETVHPDHQPSAAAAGKTFLDR